MAREPRAISSDIDIDAPIALVWSILRDFDSYPEWNPFTVSVRMASRSVVFVISSASTTTSSRPRAENDTELTAERTP